MTGKLWLLIRIPEFGTIFLASVSLDYQKTTVSEPTEAGPSVVCMFSNFRVANKDFVDG